MHTFALRACDCTFDVHCHDERTAALVASAFDALIAGGGAPGRPVRRYDILRGRSPNFCLVDGPRRQLLDDEDSLLFHLDKSITLALQHCRRDLFFLHAAAVAWNGAAVALAAVSRTGKSTLTWVALTRGFEYLSDELAPIDLRRLTVLPYARALYLKSPPPAPYELPPNAVDVRGRYYVPVNAMPARAHRQPLPVSALVFLRRDGERFNGLRSITPGSAAARLMANALNALAHPGDGLDAAAALSQAVPAYELDITDLAAATDAVREMLASRAPAERIPAP